MKQHHLNDSIQSLDFCILKHCLDVPSRILKARVQYVLPFKSLVSSQADPKREVIMQCGRSVEGIAQQASRELPLVRRQLVQRSRYPGLFNLNVNVCSNTFSLIKVSSLSLLSLVNP
jgi:hypothetical protein